MPRCQNCDAVVSNAYARVAGDNDDTVHACQECGTLAANERRAAGVAE